MIDKRAKRFSDADIGRPPARWIQCLAPNDFGWLLPHAQVSGRLPRNATGVFERLPQEGTSTGPQLSSRYVRSMSDSPVKMENNLDHRVDRSATMLRLLAYAMFAGAFAMACLNQLSYGDEGRSRLESRVCRYR